MRRILSIACTSAICLAFVAFTSPPAFAAANTPSQSNQPHNQSLKGASRVNLGVTAAGAVSGNFVISEGNSKAEKVHSFFASRTAQFGITNPAEELRLVSEETDELGYTHIRFQQEYQGIPVWGSQTIVHFSDNETIYLVGGQTIATPKLNTIVPAISELTSTGKAKAEIKNDVHTTDLTAEDEVIIYALSGEPRLARMVTITSPSDGSIRWRVFIDAETGEVIDTFNDIHFDGPDTGSGIDVLGQNQVFPIYDQGGSYQMRDISRNGEIRTYQDFYNGGSLSIDPDFDKIWDDNSAQPAEVSGHVYAAITYDYFLNTFGRDSYNNAGADIIVNVHDPRYVNNAYWNGQALNFADGDGVNYLPFSGSLDVVAHELTHAVTSYTAGLIYQYQSGALNESFSDVFGSCVDRDNWLLGEDIKMTGNGYIRSMANPTSTGQPAHMDNFLWLDISVDNGGVHINSGIPNHAFFWAVGFLGYDKCEQIWYRTLTTYLTPNSGMYFWAAMTVQSTIDLYGAGSPEHNAIITSLAQVGLTSPYPDPYTMTVSAVAGDITSDTLWIHNPSGYVLTLDTSATAPVANLELSIPATVAANDSAAVVMTYDASALDACDVGLFSELLTIDASSTPGSNNFYIPLDVFIGYTATAQENMSISTSCMSFVGSNTSSFQTLSKSGVDAVYDGSLIVGLQDGSTKTAYRNVFGTLSLIPVDTIQDNATLKSFRLASNDGRVQGTVTYSWYDGPSSDSCSFIIAEYFLENLCDTNLTVYPGLYGDFDINSSSNNLAGYDAGESIVFVKDNSSSRAAGFTLLSSSAYNLRAIHNPDLVWNDNFTDENVFGELSAASNVSGISTSDYSALLSVGPTMLESNSGASFTAAFLYSTSSEAGLVDARNAALAFISEVDIMYGDASGDGTINIGDAVFLINYIFKGGPAPDPIENGDANCDGSVNVGDAVFLVNFIFNGGPAPGCP
ncbi:MAG: M4 family metallopeptidase [Candidatus Zixiibacteriota bacterium]